MSFEGSAINGSQDIERKQSVTGDGLPDRWTTGRTGQINSGLVIKPIS